MGEVLERLGGALFAGGKQAERPAARLDTARVPVLVISGSEDRIIPAGHAQQAPAGAEVHVLQGAGHMVQMEQASEVTGLLKRHIIGR